MCDRRPVIITIPWLELALLSVGTAFLFILVPEVAAWVLNSLNPYNWSRWSWVAVNFGAVLLLFGIRFRSELGALLAAVRSLGSQSGISARIPRHKVDHDADYEARTRRDAEWRKRARKRLPFT